MAKAAGDFPAPRALHIPEAGIGALHQVLLLESPLLLERDEGEHARGMFSWSGHHPRKPNNYYFLILSISVSESSLLRTLNFSV